MSSEMVSKLNIETVRELAKEGDRLDGRKLLERRELKIETGVVDKAEGSARVKLGNTDVMVGVKMALGTPFSDRPDEGVLMTGAELSQMAHEEFERGPPSDEAIEIARVMDRVIRESGMIALDKLKVDDEHVWVVNVDLYPLNADGNLFDAGLIAAVAALSTAKMPKVKDGAILYGEDDKDMPVVKKPSSFTFAKVGEALLLDPTSMEEDVMDARLTVGVADGKICALQKGGDEGLTDEEITTMLSEAVKLAKKE